MTKTTFYYMEAQNTDVKLSFSRSMTRHDTTIVRNKMLQYCLFVLFLRSYYFYVKPLVELEQKEALKLAVVIHNDVLEKKIKPINSLTLSETILLKLYTTSLCNAETIMSAIKQTMDKTTTQLDTENIEAWLNGRATFIWSNNYKKLLSVVTK